MKRQFLFKLIHQLANPESYPHIYSVGNVKQRGQHQVELTLTLLRGYACSLKIDGVWSQE